MANGIERSGSTDAAATDQEPDPNDTSSAPGPEGLAAVAKLTPAMVSAVLAGVVLLALTALPLLVGSNSVTTVVADVSQLAAAAAAGFACWRTSRSTSGRMHKSWAAVSLGCLGWAVGQAVWTVLDLTHPDDVPYPSLADVGFLLFPVGAIACLLLFPPAVGINTRARSVLDGCALLAALLAIYWAIAGSALVDPNAAALTVPHLIVTIAYPAGDILIIGLAFYAVSRPTRHRLPLALLAGGVSAMALADAGFAALPSNYQTGRLPDLGWVAAFLFLTFAAVAGGRLLAIDRAAGLSPSPSQPPGASMMPYLPLALAATTIGILAIAGNSPGLVETLAVSAAVAAVLLRQYLTVRDNRRLLEVVASRENQLVRQAFQDQLTGLNNRALFTDRVAHALDLHRRDLRPLGLLFCDLDDFKTVNDTFGHGTGDQLLIRVAERLRGALRDGDTVARFGGDEFAILLEDGSEPTAVATRIIDTLRAPFVINDTVIHIGISVGVTDLDGEAPIPTLDELLAHADVAMYSAKRSGKGQLALYESSMVLPAIVDLRLREPLRAALRTGGIEAVYQPIIDLTDGRMAAVETLARWMHDGMQVSPVEFVPLAGRSGLLSDLTDHMLDQACGQLAKWTEDFGDRDLRIAVNIPPQMIVDLDFPERVARVLGRHSIRPEQLTLEITEDALLADLVTARTVTNRLRILGPSLSLDDFGTGYSSLVHLQRIPLDALKIDISFIAEIDRDPDAERFLRALLTLGRDLGLSVTAEGVEREAQAATLRRLGCPMAQGFLFARPSTAAELESGFLLPDAFWSPAPAAPRVRRVVPGR